MTQEAQKSRLFSFDGRKWRDFLVKIRKVQDQLKDAGVRAEFLTKEDASECLGNGGEQPGVFIVPVYVSGVFIHRVLHAQDSRILSVFGIYHADTLVVFHGEVNVLEDALALSSCAKGIYRCHCDDYRH